MKIYLAWGHDFDAPILLGAFISRKLAWGAVLQEHYNRHVNLREQYLRLGRMNGLWEKWAWDDQFYCIRRGFVQEIKVKS